MAEPIPVEALRSSLLLLFEEVMEQVHNFILDDGTSMFETLSGVTADEASRPLSERNASLAAQVNHVRFCTQYAACDAAMVERRRPVNYLRIGPGSF